MADVTRLPTQARQVAPQQGITSGQRFLIYSIWDLCNHISEQTEHHAFFRYSGHVHLLSVEIVPPEHGHPRDGGDNTWERCWSAHVDLPPSTLAEADPIRRLGDIITTLRTYLPEGFTPGGAA